VGETDRRRHVGVRVTPVLLNRPEQSVVLRTVWRVKKVPLGSPGNTRPDYQQLLSPVELVIWIDSSEEPIQTDNLEARVQLALRHPERITRFGGLSLGESTHLVDTVTLLQRDRQRPFPNTHGLAFLRAEKGRMTLPVWVDHVGSAGTHYFTGNLERMSLDAAPDLTRMPIIEPRKPAE
jgi:CRISPR-associated protein Cas5t